MSYDLMFFAPDAVPTDRAAFMAWFEDAAMQSEGLNFSDPAKLGLKAWLDDMLQVFSNGFDLADDHPAVASGHVAGYSYSKNAIYVDFRWSVAKEAYDNSLMYAAIHRVGFFDVSADNGAVLVPTDRGYEIAHGGGSADQETQRALTRWLSTRTAP